MLNMWGTTIPVVMARPSLRGRSLSRSRTSTATVTEVMTARTRALTRNDSYSDAADALSRSCSHESHVPIGTGSGFASKREKNLEQASRTVKRSGQMESKMSAREIQAVRGELEKSKEAQSRLKLEVIHSQTKC